MMPIHLNFIKSENRREIRTAAVLAWLRNVARSLFIIIFVFDGFLALIFFLFHDQVQIIYRISNDSSQRYAFYNEEIRNINERAGQLNLAGKNFGTLTARFWSLVNSVPQDIKISGLVFDTNDTTMTIPGVAKTRDALIEYDAALSALPWVEKTNLPKSQLLKKEDVPFLITVTIKPDAK